VIEKLRKRRQSLRRFVTLSRYPLTAPELVASAAALEMNMGETLPPPLRSARELIPPFSEAKAAAATKRTSGGRRKGHDESRQGQNKEERDLLRRGHQES